METENLGRVWDKISHNDVGLEWGEINHQENHLLWGLSRCCQNREIFGEYWKWAETEKPQNQQSQARNNQTRGTWRVEKWFNKADCAARFQGSYQPWYFCGGLSQAWSKTGWWLAKLTCSSEIILLQLPRGRLPQAMAGLHMRLQGRWRPNLKKFRRKIPMTWLRKYTELVF